MASVVIKKQICPALVNSALQKLTKILQFAVILQQYYPFYSNITFDNEWENLSEKFKICCNDRFASNHQLYISRIRLYQKKCFCKLSSFSWKETFQSEITIGQLMNHNKERRMLSDDQISWSFKNIRGTPQYFQTLN